MKTLWIHWRKAHITADAGHALREVLLAHPGDDQVAVATSTEKMMLGLTCDASSREMRERIREVTDPAITLIVEDSETKPFPT